MHIHKYNASWSLAAGGENLGVDSAKILSLQ